jgi:hypothetical protein
LRFKGETKEESASDAQNSELMTNEASLAEPADNQEKTDALSGDEESKAFERDIDGTENPSNANDYNRGGDDTRPCNA